jgi:hypothetical protein
MAKKEHLVRKLVLPKVFSAVLQTSEYLCNSKGLE